MTDHEKVDAEAHEVIAEREEDITEDGILDGKPWFLTVFAEANRRAKEPRCA